MKKGRFVNSQFCVAYIANLTFLLLALSSCSKLVETEAPKDRVGTNSVFSDSSNATSSVVGLYINAVGLSTELKMMNGGLSVFTGLSSDELVPSDVSDAGLSMLFSNSLTSDNSIVSSLWTTGYSLIYQANACLEGLEASTSLTESLRSQLIGESKFVRAWVYFHLVNIFGDVPIISSTNYKHNSSLPRHPVKDVYDFIKSDLIGAEKLVSLKYASQGRYRPNKSAIQFLLSKTYLYNEQWAACEEKANEVISNSTYVLETDLLKVFSSSSKEAIWQMLPIQEGFETAEAHAFVPIAPDIVPSFYLNDNLLNSFQSIDKRKEYWLGKNTVTQTNTVDYYYPAKYKVANSSSEIKSESGTVLRLGDMLLIRAEARAEQGKLSEANSDLNLIRNRAGLGDTSILDKDELVKAITEERKVELFCEWGNRWFDLKRTQKINDVMSVVAAQKGGAWKTEWQVYPIPISEIRLNSKLLQNKDY